MTTAAIITISVIALVYIIAKNIQLYKFTSYMHTCMDELYEQDRCEKESISIYKSWRNFDISFPWIYRFQDMVVYEKRKKRA